MRKIFTIQLFIFFIVFHLAALKSSAQINADGLQHNVVYNGSFQDFLIPNNPQIAKIRFSLSGADGGAAVLRMGQNIPVPFGDDIFLHAFSYSSGGGSGAVVNATFLVGTGPGKIPFGSTVRFIVGQKGQTGTDNISVVPDGGTGSEYGGGGGGTAVIYRAPGSGTWILLGVAGGGGGAYQGVVSGIPLGLSSPGGAGAEGNNGANGGGFVNDYGLGGTNGNGGNRSVGVVGISPIGAGGGGRNTKGNGLLTYIDIADITLDETELKEAEFGEGGAGKPEGFETGGYGGTRESQPDAVFFGFKLRNGGFGYGGGAVGVGTGGGGGGYSGGGAGGLFHGGGGGGSFLNNTNESGSISSGGSDTEPDDGLAHYQVILNLPPVANCKNVTVYLNANGQASIVAADVNNGSSDPEGGTLSYGVSKSSFTCADRGNNNVTLTVTDDQGATATCVAIVTVVDNTIPVITCLPNVTVSCAADVAAPNVAVLTVTDNCPVNVTHEGDVITNQTCANRFTLTRTYRATDASGNTATCQQVITVSDNQAPVITNASTSVVYLWPPNHKMRDVVVNYNTADNCATATTTLSISSNEPVNGTGDGDTAPDWEIVNNHLVKLRAERAGNRSGRIYTITITANDGCNNISTKTLNVYVDHDQSITARPNAAEAGETERTASPGILMMHVQPNPSSHDFRMLVNSGDIRTPIRLRVFNSAGQVVETIQVSPARSVLFGNNLMPGVYMVEAVQGKNRQTIKVIKM